MDYNSRRTSKEEIALKIAEVLNWNEDQIKRFTIYNNNNQDYKEGVYSQILI